MSRALPAKVAEVGAALATSAGGYLHNAVREPYATCGVCSTPVDGYEMCFKCREHARLGLPVADRVASLVYAVKRYSNGQRDQMYTAMYGYKGPVPQPGYVKLIRSLLILGLVGHFDCDRKLSGQPEIRWAAVPGTQHAGREHPLHALIAPLFTSPEFEVPLSLPPGAEKDRGVIKSQKLEVGATIPAGTHVAVLDDSWVTGGSAQSAAAALRDAGAASVSILTVARVLEPSYPTTAEFLKSDYWKRDFDYRICPWTGGDCP